MIAEHDLVTRSDIAHRLDVSPKTVDQWRQRNLAFPEPVRRFENVPVWEWGQVEVWARETGRL